MESLLKLTRPGVLRMATVRIGDSDDAEDVTQNVLINITRGLPGFRVDSSYSSWAFRIAQNELVAFIRRRRLLARTAERWKNHHLDRSWTDLEGRRLDWERLCSRVEVMVESLPPQQRVAVEWVDLHGFLPAEAAKMLRKTPGSFRSQLCRGRKRVKAALEGMSSNLLLELLGTGIANGE